MPAETECDVVVVGAGVIGLAIAAKLPKNLSTVLVESHDKFGQETSSRNSEVIHSGIYYPAHSNKTKLCIRGRKLLYAYSEKHSIAHRKCGKFVVATESSDLGYLEKLKAHSESLEIPCRFSSVEESLVQALGALYFPETGIVNSHELMLSLEREYLDNGGVVAYRQTVSEINKGQNGWVLKLNDSSIKSKWVVNAAGLYAAALSNQALKTSAFEHRFCRGRYFSLSHSYLGKFNHLIYPVPVKDGLGVHVTIDTSGMARLGPDVDWCSSSDYNKRSQWYDCDWDSLRPAFVRAAQRYCPSVKAEDITPGLIGIRPKLFVNGIAAMDFLIENTNGFIHCLGIESPGLTSVLAIAETVAEIIG